MKKKLSKIFTYGFWIFVAFIFLNHFNHYENEVTPDGFHFSRGYKLFGKRTYTKDFASGRELIEIRDGFGNQTQIEFDSQNNLVSSVFKFKKFLLLRQSDNSITFSKRLTHKTVPFKVYEAEFSAAHKLRDAIRESFIPRIGKEPAPVMPKPKFDLPSDFNDSKIPYLDDGFEHEAPPPPDSGVVPPNPEKIN